MWKDHGSFGFKHQWPPSPHTSLPSKSQSSFISHVNILKHLRNLCAIQKLGPVEQWVFLLQFTEKCFQRFLTQSTITYLVLHLILQTWIQWLWGISKDLVHPKTNTHQHSNPYATDFPTRVVKVRCQWDMTGIRIKLSKWITLKGTILTSKFWLWEKNKLNLIFLLTAATSNGFESFFFFPAMWCGMWGLSSPNRDWTHAPCSGSPESYPLDHKASPSESFLMLVNYYLEPWRGEKTRIVWWLGVRRPGLNSGFIFDILCDQRPEPAWGSGFFPLQNGTHNASSVGL